MANVEPIFHQVRISPNDCDTLRFLWWTNNALNSEPKQYQMMVHLFGTTSSPSCANFGHNCQEFSKEAVDSVKDNFYADNCLKSAPSETEAIGLVNKLCTLLSKGGFRLTKPMSKPSLAMVATYRYLPTSL